jgi:coproporphyrinogen III oxidase
MTTTWADMVGGEGTLMTLMEKGLYAERIGIATQDVFREANKDAVLAAGGRERERCD